MNAPENFLGLIPRNVLRWIAAAILLQTLYFKFTGAPESVYIFTKVGAEPYGRIGSGVVELVAAAFLLYRPLTPFGAVIALGTMTGAILSHFTLLGIDVLGDGGLLFGLAVTVWVSSLLLALDGRRTLQNFVLRSTGRISRSSV